METKPNVLVVTGRQEDIQAKVAEALRADGRQAVLATSQTTATRRTKVEDGYHWEFAVTTTIVLKDG